MSGEGVTSAKIIKKLPPKIGTLALVLEIACAKRWPEGAFLAPPIKCQIVPPARPEASWKVCNVSQKPSALQAIKYPEGKE